MTVATSVEVAPDRVVAPVRRSTTARALAAWVGVVVLGHLLVRWVMIDTGVQRHDAAPLHAMFDPELHRSLLWAVLLGGGAIWGAERFGAPARVAPARRDVRLWRERVGDRARARARRRPDHRDLHAPGGVPPGGAPDRVVQLVPRWVHREHRELPGPRAESSARRPAARMGTATSRLRRILLAVDALHRRRRGRPSRPRSWSCVTSRASRWRAGRSRSWCSRPPRCRSRPAPTRCSPASARWRSC